jgi:hypothetical protein|tara:strand:+ start:689 stop:910 length:222 start_codon:yes stop_codon:yes gene_type:complete
MKRGDIAALVFVATVSMVIAYFVANAFIGGPTSESETVKTTDPITDNIVEPDETIFNEDAINPTVEVVIGENK